VLASIVIDRLCDGLSVLLMVVVTLFALRLPQGMAEAEHLLRLGFLFVFLLCCGLLLFLFLLKHRTAQTLSFVRSILKPFPHGVSDRAISMLESFVAGIRISVHGRHICAIVASSLLIWIFCVLPVDMILQGFSIHLPITASMFIMALLVGAVMIPAAPGYIGTYHYACSMGLMLFGMNKTIATSIALLIHATSFFPVIIAGFFHLWSSKMSLGGVRNPGEGS